MNEYKLEVDVPESRQVTVTLPADFPTGKAELVAQPLAPEGTREPLPDWLARDPKFSREWDAYHRMLPQLLQTHRGKYVAIHEGQVVGSGTDKIAVSLDAHRRFGAVPILIREVTETPRVVHNISPF